MPATYNGLDLECIYPENWTFSEDASPEGPIGFTIDSPEAAFFSLIRYPWNSPPREVLDAALPALKEEYEQLESAEIDPGLAIDDSRGLELQFYCLDLLITSKLLAFTVRPYTYLVQMQAEDRAFEKIEPVFQAILISILRSLKK